jgi:hypothetical protein
VKVTQVRKFSVKSAKLLLKDENGRLSTEICNNSLKEYRLYTTGKTKEGKTTRAENGKGRLVFLIVRDIPKRTDITQTISPVGRNRQAKWIQ